MRTILLAAALAAPLPALADGYVMGAGRWTCADALAVAKSDDASRVGQLAGWIMGFWSAATFQRESSFVDIVENVGAQKIYEATLTECQKAPGDVPIYKVAESMISNTK